MRIGRNLARRAERSDRAQSPELSPLDLLLDNLGAHGRGHAHRCLACNSHFECTRQAPAGPCTPLCEPCYWVELGSQLSFYEEVAGELRKRRADIEARVG